MAFSFRNLFSGNKTDADDSGSHAEPEDKALIPEDYFVGEASDLGEENDFGTDSSLHDATWRPRRDRYRQGEPAASALTSSPTDSKTSIPINRLAAYIPASLLREETARSRKSIELGLITKFTRKPRPVFTLSLLRLFEITPELFVRSILPAEDREIVIPEAAFREAVDAQQADTRAPVAYVMPRSTAYPTPESTAADVQQASAAELSRKRQAAEESGLVSRSSSSVARRDEPSAAPGLQAADENPVSAAKRVPPPPGNRLEKLAVPATGPSLPMAVKSPFSAGRGATTMAPRKSEAEEISSDIPSVSSRIDPKTTDPAVLTFHLRELLQHTSRKDLGFDPARIPSHVTTEVLLESVEHLLARAGRVDLPIGKVIEGCQERHQPAFARARADIIVNLPLEEIRRQMTALAPGDRSFPQQTPVPQQQAPSAGNEQHIDTDSQGRPPRITNRNTIAADAPTEKGKAGAAAGSSAIASPPAAAGPSQRSSLHDSPRALQAGPARPQEAPGKPDQPGSRMTEAAVASALREIMLGVGNRRDALDENDSAAEVPTHPKQEPGRAALPGTTTTGTSSSSVPATADLASLSKTQGLEAKPAPPTEQEHLAVAEHSPGAAAAAARLAHRENATPEDAPETILECRIEEIPQQFELQAIFDVSHPMGVQEMIDRCASLPGIEACLVVSPAGEIPASTSSQATGACADFYRKAARIYESVILLTGATGVENVAVLKVKTESGTHTYFRHDDCCLAVRLDHASLAEGVREKLIVVARELPGLIKKSERSRDS